MKQRQSIELVRIRVTNLSLAGPYPQKIRKYGIQGLRYKLYISGFIEGQFATITTQFTLSDSPDGHLYVVSKSKLFKESVQKEGLFVDLHWGNYYKCLLSVNEVYDISCYLNRVKTTQTRKVYYKVSSYERIS